MITNLFKPNAKKVIAALALGLASFASAPEAQAARGAGNSESAQAGGETPSGGGGGCCGGEDRSGPTSSRDEGGNDPRITGVCSGKVDFDNSTVEVDGNAQDGYLSFLAKFSEIIDKFSRNENIKNTPIIPIEYGISGTFNVNMGRSLPFYECQRALVGQAVYDSGFSENVGADIIAEIENSGLFGFATYNQKVLLPQR